MKFDVVKKHSLPLLYVQSIRRDIIKALFRKVFHSEWLAMLKASTKKCPETRQTKINYLNYRSVSQLVIINCVYDHATQCKQPENPYFE